MPGASYVGSDGPDGQPSGPKTPPSYTKLRDHTAGAPKNAHALPPMRGGMMERHHSNVSEMMGTARPLARPRHTRNYSDADVLAILQPGFSRVDNEFSGLGRGPAGGSMGGGEAPVDKFRSVDSAALRGMLAARNANIRTGTIHETPNISAISRPPDWSTSQASPSAMSGGSNLTRSNTMGGEYSQLNSGFQPLQGSGGSILYSPNALGGGAGSPTHMSGEPRYGSVRMSTLRQHSGTSDRGTSEVVDNSPGRAGAANGALFSSELTSSASWGEDSLELAAAKARAAENRGAQSYFQIAEETYQLQVGWGGVGWGA